MSIPVTDAQFEIAKGFLEKMYEDQEFVDGILRAAEQEKASEYAASHGIDVTQANWMALKEMSQQGQHFDLRLAGGVYRFASNTLGFSELLVDPSTRMIYLDGQEADGPPRVQASNVTFSTSAGTSFEIQFKCAPIVGERPSPPAFKGTVSLSDNQKKISISGAKYYLWGNVANPEGNAGEDYVPEVDPQISEQQILAAEKVREDKAVSSIAFCLDLATKPYTHDVQLMAAPDGWGDVYLEGIHVGLSVAGAALGAFVAGPGGAAIGAAGSQFSRILTASIKQAIHSRMSRRLQNYITQSDVQLKEMLRDRANYWVQKIKEEDLDDKENVDRVRKELAKDYKLRCRDTLRKEIFSKFFTMHLLFGEEFIKVFKDNTATKFETDVSKEMIDKVITVYIRQRQSARDVPSWKNNIRELRENLRIQEGKLRKELEDIENRPDKDGKNAKERSEIEKRYAEERQRIEREIQDNESRVADHESGKHDREITDRLDEAEKEAKEYREREKRSQDALRRPKNRKLKE